ncbi:MAG: hypothetical protein Q9194_001385, partial [Teloschistes cf. exilis]
NRLPPMLFAVRHHTTNGDFPDPPTGPPAGSDNEFYDSDINEFAELPDIANLIQSPKKIRSKGRPKGSLNKMQQIFENSSRREPSGFERVDASIAATQGQRQRRRKAGSQRRAPTRRNQVDEASNGTSTTSQPATRRRRRGPDEVAGVPIGFTSLWQI